MQKFDGFKLSVLAVCVAAASQVQANDTTAPAKYSIERVGSEVTQLHASAISPEAQADKNCFIDSCVAGDYSVAGEVLRRSEGEPMRDEVPFFGAFRFDMDERKDFEEYCFDFLGYSYCDSNDGWADNRFQEVLKERNGWNALYSANLSAYNDGDAIDLSTLSDDQAGETVNSVSNGYTSNGDVFGITSAGFKSEGANYSRQFAKRGFVDGGISQVFNPPAAPEDAPTDADLVLEAYGNTMVFDSVEFEGQTLFFGSSATKVFGNGYGEKSGSTSCKVGTASEACNQLSFVTQAYVWDQTGTAYPMVSGWLGGGNSIQSNEARQASARAAAVVNDKLYAVGYSTRHYIRNGINMSAQAVVFKPNTAFDLSNTTEQEQWTLERIPGFTFNGNDNDEFLYSNAIDINSQGIVVGHLKNRLASNRTFPLRSFIYDVNSETDAKSLESLNSFFTGKSTEITAINNANEIVGWTDVESVNEIQGRKRRQRGFIYLYGDAPRNLTELDNETTWLLDDLTYFEGQSSSDPANQYRIGRATDINDAGVVAATALYCEGGYSSVASNATCDGDEVLVSVKLTPNSDGQTAKRPVDSTSVERKGAGFGWLTFGLLALGLIRRRQG